VRSVIGLLFWQANLTILQNSCLGFISHEIPRERINGVSVEFSYGFPRAWHANSVEYFTWNPTVYMENFTFSPWNSMGTKPGPLFRRIAATVIEMNKDFQTPATVILPVTSTSYKVVEILVIWQHFE